MNIIFSCSSMQDIYSNFKKKYEKGTGNFKYLRVYET